MKTLGSLRLPTYWALRRVVGHERVDVGEAVRGAADSIGLHADDARLGARLHHVRTRYARQGVPKVSEYRVVRRGMSVGGAVGAHQASGDCDAGRGALSGDARVGDAAGDVDREQAEIDAVDERRGADDGGRRGVVAELELVQHPASHDALQVEHRVGRVVGDVDSPAGHALELVARPLVVEGTNVG